MAILKVARMGHPILNEVTADLSEAEICSPEMQRLMDDMIETMHDHDGVGLAGPQVHENKRLLIVEFAPSPNASDLPIVPLTVLFNFRITEYGKEIEEEFEGCLSIPGLRGLVPRPNKIKVSARDRNGKVMSFQATGFFARMLQHEGDHLDGVLFPQRMSDMSTLAFVEEFNRFQLDDAD